MGSDLTAIQALILLLLTGAGILAVTGLLRTDLIGLSVLFVLAASGAISPVEAFRGFSSPAVITLAGLFVLTQAMDKGGFVYWIAARIERLAGRSEKAVMAVFLLVGAALSLVVNTAAAGAVLLPAVVGVAKSKDIPVSRLLLPMGFGVIVGGTATIFTTANIIMSGLLEARGYPGLTMQDFFPTGLVLVMVTLGYFMAVGSRLLPSVSLSEKRGLGSRDLADIYAMHERLWELRVLPGSELSGKNLAEIQLGAPVLAIWHGRTAIFNPSGASWLEEGDIILVSCAKEELPSFRSLGLRVGRDRQLGGSDIPVVMIEMVIPPRSKAIGKSLAELSFHKTFGLTGVALWRGGESCRKAVGSAPLRAGDALLLVGSVENAVRLADHPDYLVVDTPTYPPLSRFKSFLTLLVAGAVLSAAGIGLVSMSLAAFSGALFLVLLGVMDVDEAYDAIDWRVLFLIAGMFPMGVAMERSGLTGLFSNLFYNTFSETSDLLPVAAIYLFTVLMTQIVGGQVSALFTGPVALSAAQDLGIDMVAMAVLVGIACSNCFITAIAHPVNLLVSGPGGYKSADFLRVGFGLQLLCFLAAMLMARVYWGIV